MPGGFSDHELVQAGFIPGMPGSTIGPFDRTEKFVERETQPDDVWEERDGVRTKYQPQTLLLSEPLLWRPYSDWLLGLHELSESAVASRSNFEVEAILQLASTRARKVMPKREDDGGR